MYVCMYVCMYIYIYIYIYLYIYIYVHIYIHIYMHRNKCVYVHTHMCIYIQMHTCIHIQTHVYTSKCTDTCIHEQVHRHMYTRAGAHRGASSSLEILPSHLFRRNVTFNVAAKSRRLPHRRMRHTREWPNLVQSVSVGATVATRLGAPR